MNSLIKQNNKMNEYEACLYMAQFLEDKKAQSVCVFDLSACRTLNDYMILATASSMPHQEALQTLLLEECKRLRIPVLNVIERSNPWILVDLDFVCVHLFLDEARSLYALESLWSRGVLIHGLVPEHIQEPLQEQPDEN